MTRPEAPPEPARPPLPPPPTRRIAARGVALAAIVLLALAAACVDRPGPLSPDRAGPCRVVGDDPATRARRVSGPCGNTSGIVLPAGWVARRVDRPDAGWGAPPDAPRATVVASATGRGALAAASSMFSTVAMPDAEYVGSTTRITWGNFSGTVLTDGALTVTFNRHVHWSQVPDFWATWSSPPYSEESAPHVMQVDYFNTDEFPEFTYTEMRLSQPVTAFGFELEPRDWEWVQVAVRFYAGDSLVGTVDQAVHGNAGARLFAARSPDRPIDRVTIFPNGPYALAQLRYTLAAQPTLQLACTPATVTRADAIACTAASSDPSQPPTMSAWSFTSSEGLRHDRPDYLASNKAWSGALVASGEVLAEGTIAGRPVSATAPVRVNTRDWARKVTPKDHAIVTPTMRPYHPTGFRGELGMTDLSLPRDSANPGRWSKAILDDGPNDGYSYLIDVPFITFTRADVNYPVMTVGSDFYNLQEKRDKVVRERQSDGTFKDVTYCGQSWVTGILPMVEAHEGTSPDQQPDSHAGIYRVHVDTIAGPRLEPIAGPAGLNFNATIEGIHAEAAADAVTIDDSTSTRNPIRMSCVFHYFGPPTIDTVPGPLGLPSLRLPPSRQLRIR